MQLEWIEPDRIDAEWPAMLEALTPSLAFDKERTPDAVRFEIRCSRLVAWRVFGDAEGYVLAAIGRIDDSAAQALWVVHVGGKMQGGPKHRLANIRALTSTFEQMAAALGCDEVRIEGRVAAWGRLLPEYQQSGSALRKEM